MENQNIEYKSIWRDEYLKWICGFANAGGGKLLIGVDDNGDITGLEKTSKLLEDIPNKIKDVLGIIPLIELHTENHKDYLEITIEDQNSPISYRGQYFFRSGSTNQELKGPALERFLLSKIGKKWDGVSIEYDLSLLSPKSLEIFKKEASRSRRIPDSHINDSFIAILEHLKLKEHIRLKRAAVLLFTSDTEKLVSGSYVKIGFFNSDDDLVFHNVIYGSLFEQVETSLDFIHTKYLKESIDYTRSTRIEKHPYPEKAIREALLNALVHKDYSSGIPIQISVYRDKIVFWNPGVLPDNWTIENLKSKHASHPYNPDIASVFFLCGYIDAWGKGIHNLIKSCNEYGLPMPIFEYDGNGITVTLRASVYNYDYLKDVGLAEDLIKIVLFAKENESVSNSQVQKMLNISKSTAFRYLRDLDGSYLVKIGEKGRNTKYVIK